MKQIEAKLIELRNGKAPDLIKPMKTLEGKFKKKIEVAAIRKKLRQDLIKVKFTALPALDYLPLSALSHRGSHLRPCSDVSLALRRLWGSIHSQKAFHPNQCV